jgi:hypothetical protein
MKSATCNVCGDGASWVLLGTNHIVRCRDVAETQVRCFVRQLRYEMGSQRNDTDRDYSARPPLMQ